ncbi:MAG: MFS transporter [Anaerolineales bacterium]
MIEKTRKIVSQFIKHRLFMSVYLPSFLVAFAWGVRMPILPLYAREISNVYGLIGLIVAGAGLGKLLTDLPAGNLIWRMDKRLAMILGIALDGLSTLALVWSNSIWLAIIFCLLGGVGHAIFSIARHTYITNAVRVNIRGRALSIFGGILRIGLFLGPALGGVLAAKIGLRVPFVAFALISMAAILMLFFAKDHFDAETHQDSHNPKLGFREVFTGRVSVFAMASLAHVLAQITRAGEGLILPLWGADVLNLSPDQIGWTVSLSAGVSMILFYPVGLIMDRLGRKFAIIPSFVIMGLGLALLPLTNGFAGLLWVSAMIGLGHGMGSGTMLVLGSDLSPQKGRSLYLGAWSLIGDFGNSSGPLILGFVADILALPFASLTIAGAGVLAGAMFGFFVPETLKKKQQPEKIKV